MARAIWSGSISFGLINVPVKLYSAVTERNVRFNQIDTRNGARIRTRKVNAEDGSEVPPEAIAKGYEVAKGRYVVVTEDDLAALQPRATHTIDLEEFVDLAEVDPVYFDGAYHVAPDGRSAKPYALLVAAMEEAGKVAVARFVMRSKQYVAIMRPVDGRLLLSMMVYEDELNPASDLPEFDQLEGIEISERELAMAEQLVASLSAEWEPGRYRDTYREDVLDLVHAKDAGREVVPAAAEAPTDDKVVDLMAALEASVAAAREARGRHPSAGRVPASGSVPARRATTRKAGSKQAGSKQAGAKQAGVKQATARKTAPRKATAGTTTPRKATPKKTAPRKAAAGATTPRKAAARKVPTAGRAPARRRSA